MEIHFFSDGFQPDMTISKILHSKLTRLFFIKRGINETNEC